MSSKNDLLHVDLLRKEEAQKPFEEALVDQTSKRINRLRESMSAFIGRSWVSGALNLTSVSAAIIHFNGLATATFDLVQQDIAAAMAESKLRAAEDMFYSIQATEQFSWSRSPVLNHASVKVKNTFVMDSTLPEWISGQSLYLRRRVGQVLRAALRRKDSTHSAVLELFSPTSGPFRMAASQASNLSVTAIRAARMQTFQVFYDLNAKDIQAIQAIATLDEATSEGCWRKHGWAWKTDGSPSTGVGITPPEKYPGPTPWHFNCRTVVFPVLEGLGVTFPLTYEQFRAAR